MSDIVAEFNPATAPRTTFTVPQSAASGALVFWNESNISLNLTLQNGTRFYLPAWYNKHLCGYSGNVNIAWDIRTVLASGPPPTSEVIVEAYAHGEHFPADGALVRQANGDTNSVTTQNTLVNDGAAAGTSIIEAKQTTSSGSNVAVDNSGNLTIAEGGVTPIALTPLLKTIAGTGVQLGNGLRLTEILGALQADGNLTFNSGTHTITLSNTGNNNLNVLIDGAQAFQINPGGIDANILSGGGGLTGNLLKLKNGTHVMSMSDDASGNLNVLLDGAQAFQVNPGGIDTNILSGGGTLTTQNVAFVNGTNTSKIQVDASGNMNVDLPSGTRAYQLNAGGIDLKTYSRNISVLKTVFTTGSITAISAFTGSTTNTYSHGLGVTPDIVIPMVNVSGSQSMGYDTLTATTVHITSPSSVSFKALAIKF